MSKAWKITISAAAAPLVLIALVTLAWGIDTWLRGDNVERNVNVAGAEVGGMNSKQLAQQVTKLADQLPTTPVEITADGDTMKTTAGELGLAIDADRTVSRVHEVGRTDPLPTRPIRWFLALFTYREADVAVRVDTGKLSLTLVELEGDKRQPAVEPTMEASEDGVKIVPGKDGSSITVHDVVAALPSTLGDVTKPILIKVDRTPIEPPISDEVAQKLADKSNEATKGPITLDVGGKKIEIPGKEFRPAFTMTSDHSQLTLSMNSEAVAKVLAAHVKIPANPTNVRFDIVNGVPTPVGGEDAKVCCTPEAPKLIVAGMMAGDSTIAVPPRVVTAEAGRKWAAGLGVKEIVGSFTTKHPCCASRVTNIHRIADLTRGILIAPGETFSVNDAVGMRTAAKGFVSAGVIEDGEHTTDVGGGVSQYATTLFNAAFFGGLDIPEHKAHSEYISRYPFGREATLWYPSVDLKIRNETPYGVVIWPTYTGTSLTADLWSTRNITTEQTGQHPTSGCGKITTERTRTWPDGHTKVDKFYASYRCL